MAEHRPPVGRIRTLEDLLKRADTGDGEVKLHLVSGESGYLQERFNVHAVVKTRDDPTDPILQLTVQRYWPSAGRKEHKKFYASGLGLVEGRSGFTFLFPTRSGADMYSGSLRKPQGTPPIKHYALEDQTV